MLGVFLLLAFTCLGHERQDLLRPCDGMHTCVHWLDLGLYSYRKEFLGNGVRTHVNSNSKGKITSTRKKFSPKEYRTQDAASSRMASPTHYQRGIPAPNGDEWARKINLFFFYIPQLYLWASPFFDEIFAYVTVFSPTIEVVTFRLHG